MHEPDIFERFGFDLTTEQKLKLEELAHGFYTQSGGHFGLVELLHGLAKITPPDHSNLGCLCSLERQPQHPPTAWGHLQPRTMGDPCPICGGTDYYCAEMIDHVLSKDRKSFDAVMQSLSDLYEEFCQAQHKEPGKGQVQYHLARLMDAYNRWLG